MIVNNIRGQGRSGLYRAPRQVKALNFILNEMRAMGELNTGKCNDVIKKEILATG